MQHTGGMGHPSDIHNMNKLQQTACINITSYAMQNGTPHACLICMQAKFDLQIAIFRMANRDSTPCRQITESSASHQSVPTTMQMHT